MWSLLNILGAIGLQLPVVAAVFLAFLTKNYPLLPNGFANWNTFTATFPNLKDRILIGAVIIEVAILALCVRYAIYYGLPTFIVTVRRYNNLFSVIVDSLHNLVQPPSTLIEAVIRGDPDPGSDLEEDC